MVFSPCVSVRMGKGMGAETMDATGEEQAEGAPAKIHPSAMACGGSWARLIVGAMLLGMIGTWLVWFSLMIQRKQNEEDIRAACQRVMPETVDRCVDTVVIQRGGVRR